MDDLVGVLDFDGYFRQLNANWQPALGYSVAQLAAVPYTSFIHPRDLATMQATVASLTSGQVAAAQVEARFRGHDGSYRWLIWHISADRNERRLYAVVGDTTARTISGAVQAESEARFSLLFDSTAGAIVTTSAAGAFTYVSPAFAQLLGYDPSELVGRSVSDLIHVEDRRRANQSRIAGAPQSDAQTLSLRYRRKNGTYAWLERTSKPNQDPVSGDLLETQSVLRDISERKEVEAAILQQALTDSLTGLANRLLLVDRVKQGLRRLRRSPGFIGVLMLDLDRFKLINDTLGHQIGDAVLTSAAQRLQRLARPDDTVARFGGDEFVVVMQGVLEPSDVSAFADRLVSGLREPYVIGDQEIVTTVSIGIAITPRPDQHPEDLLRQADLALYLAKDRGRDRHELFGEALEARAIERLDVERVIRHAMTHEGLSVEYQPIVDLASGRAAQVEALIRIDDAQRGRLAAQDFLSTAEDAGLLPYIDDWLRVTAFTQLNTWRRAAAGGLIERIAINVTARDLSSPVFITSVDQSLTAAGLLGSDISIEVTEHVLLQTSHSAMSTLANLRAMGVQIGLDDFGTGFSALSYLRSFPLDFLKIDRSFVDQIAVDRDSRLVVGAIVDLAHALRLSVVAEGVETAEQMACVRQLGCDRAQGFLFSGPLPAPDLAAYLGNQRSAVTRAAPPA